MSRECETFDADYMRMPIIWTLGGLTWQELLRRTWRQFWKDRVLDQSAMLSFYFLLSLFPLLLFLIALLGLLLQSGPVLQATLHRYLAAVVPASASTLIDTTLGEINRGTGALKLSVALLFTWWSASKGMLAIVEGLNIAYEVGESRPWWKKYLVASGLTIVCLLLFAGALLLVIYGRTSARRACPSRAPPAGPSAATTPSYSPACRLSTGSPPTARCGHPGALKPSAPPVPEPPGSTSSMYS